MALLYTRKFLHSLPKEVRLDIINNNRRTGRSFACALSIISFAMQSPGKPVPIWDHHGTLMAKKYVALPLVVQIIKKLNLKGLNINKTNLTLTYLPFQENKNDFN